LADVLKVRACDGASGAYEQERDERYRQREDAACLPRREYAMWRTSSNAATAR
jgi:hypothetical protein